MHGTLTILLSKKFGASSIDQRIDTKLNIINLQISYPFINI